MKKLYIILILFLCCGLANAQDQIYSQFYNAPIYLNPALNGQFDGDFRVNMIYRNQWSQIPGPLNYYTLSVDYSIPSFDGGVGLMVTKSSEGTAYLNKVNLAGVYSYSVNFDNSILSFGLQAGATNSSIDYDKLVFLDQLGAQGIIPGVTSGATVPEFNNKFFFDAGVGVNLVTGNFMIGTSAQHINQPNESFTGTNSPLPVRINGYASYKLSLDPYDDESNVAVIPSVVIYHQAGLTSYSAGFQYKHNNVNIGLWYRGTDSQQDAVVISVIFDLFTRRDTYDKLRFGISHDATVSTLGYSNTAGTTEAAFDYETTFNPDAKDNGSSYRGNYGYKCYSFY